MFTEGILWIKASAKRHVMEWNKSRVNFSDTSSSFHAVVRKGAVVTERRLNVASDCMKWRTGILEHRFCLSSFQWQHRNEAFITHTHTDAQSFDYAPVPRSLSCSLLLYQKYPSPGSPFRPHHTHSLHLLDRGARLPILSGRGKGGGRAYASLATSVPLHYRLPRVTW